MWPRVRYDPSTGLERRRKSMKKASVRTACFRVDIWTLHLPNTKQECVRRRFGVFSVTNGREMSLFVMNCASVRIICSSLNLLDISIFAWHSMRAASQLHVLHVSQALMRWLKLSIQRHIWQLHTGVSTWRQGKRQRGKEPSFSK
jgi:hypothetical protein